MRALSESIPALAAAGGAGADVEQPSATAQNERTASLTLILIDPPWGLIIRYGTSASGGTEIRPIEP